MSMEFSVPMEKIITALNLRVANAPKDNKFPQVTNVNINRPGLHLAGFFEYFDKTRIQLFGKSEMEYLNLKPEDEQEKALEEILKREPVAVIISRAIDATPVMIRIAKKYNITVLTTPMQTSNFSAALNALLNTELAPRITRHGVLVEVHGEGVLITGDSGVGKSETAIELVKRGHRLIADDAVEIRRVSDRTLVGTSPENIRHFLELRGIGIINVRNIFGIGAVKVTDKIDMVINLEAWSKDKVYDRMGMDEEFTEILGLKIPSVTIPVSPGRNLAIIIEVAAMNNRQKKMGYNAAHELLQRLGMTDDIPTGSHGIEEDHFDFRY